MLRIFISYSQDDYRAGARHVRNYISRHIQDSDVFIDQFKPKGSKWRKEIEEKLEVSDIFIVILTHGALESEEVRKEVEHARKKKDRKIIPCKENLLEMEWQDLPWNLFEYDGCEFEDKEELGRRLVTEIKKIRKQEESKKVKTRMSLKGALPLVVPTGLPQNLDYSITNGEVLSVKLDRESVSLILSLASYGAGVLKLTLSRSIIDAKIGSQDDQFFVLIGGSEVEYSEETNNFERMLTIQFQKGDTEVEIIGTELLGVSFAGITTDKNTIKLLLGSSNPRSDRKYLEPHTLFIKTGEKVKWINVDTASHTITSGTPADGPTGLFDSSLISAGKTFELTFNKRGTYRYFCQVHPWTEGKIAVE